MTKMNNPADDIRKWLDEPPRAMGWPNAAIQCEKALRMAIDRLDMECSCVDYPYPDDATCDTCQALAQIAKVLGCTNNGTHEPGLVHGPK